MQNSLPKQMKAVLLTGHGGLDKLVYVDDYPVPRPGAGEVTIEVVVAPWSQHTHLSPHTGL